MIQHSCAIARACPAVDNDAYTMRITLNHACIDVCLSADNLLTYTLNDGAVLRIAPPVFPLAPGKILGAVLAPQVLEPVRALANGTQEIVIGGPLVRQPGVTLAVVMRFAVNDPVVRIHYRLTGDAQWMSSLVQADIAYVSADISEVPDTRVIELSAFNELTHSYVPVERQVDPDCAEMGPLLVASNGLRSVLLGYEHGSAANDPFLHFTLSEQRRICLQAAKGNACAGEALPWTSLWLQIAHVPGDHQAMAQVYRRFVLDHLALLPATREPLIFYNSWNHQERVKERTGSCLTEMNETRMLAEIDVAARMGIEVFVIDAGWFASTGDWQVSATRFPRGMAPIHARLQANGMRLGLWFGPQHVAVAAPQHQAHSDCLMSTAGQVGGVWSVWETADSQNMCLATHWVDAFADELIRCHRELGVNYFKWDAISQYGCDASGHGHGGTGLSATERSDRHAFLLPLQLVRIVERLMTACPQAIVDFDVTESGRAVGLAFLTVGKYFLVNNGPYFANYDLPTPTANNVNMFFKPGEARGWIARQTLAFDHWIPAILTLCHYLPDDPPAPAAEWLRPHGFADSLEVNLASLILGHNGIWGDLLAVSAPGVNRISTVLAHYHSVRDAVNRAHPRVVGRPGGSPEVHEKLHVGRGVVAFFAAQAGTWHHTTAQPVAETWWAAPAIDGDVRVERLADGRARLSAFFKRPGARLVIFGS